MGLFFISEGIFELCGYLSPSLKSPDVFDFSLWDYASRSLLDERKPLPAAFRVIVVARTGWGGSLPGRKTYRGRRSRVLTGSFCLVSVVRTTPQRRLRAPTVRIWRRRRRRSCGGPERRRKVGFLLSDEVDRSSPPTAQIWELLEETLPERDAPGLLLQLKWS